MLSKPVVTKSKIFANYKYQDTMWLPLLFHVREANKWDLHAMVIGHFNSMSHMIPYVNAKTKRLQK